MPAAIDDPTLPPTTTTVRTTCSSEACLHHHPHQPGACCPARFRPQHSATVVRSISKHKLPAWSMHDHLQFRTSTRPPQHNTQSLTNSHSRLLDTSVWFHPYSLHYLPLLSPPCAGLALDLDLLMGFVVLFHPWQAWLAPSGILYTITEITNTPSGTNLEPTLALECRHIRATKSPPTHTPDCQNTPMPTLKHAESTTEAASTNSWSGRMYIC